MTKKQKEMVASNNGVKVYFIYQLLSKKKYTTIPGLAIDLAKFTGKKPIKYFNPRKRHIIKSLLSAYPELGELPKKRTSA